MKKTFAMILSLSLILMLLAGCGAAPAATINDGIVNATGSSYSGGYGE